MSSSNPFTPEAIATHAEACAAAAAEQGAVQGEAPWSFPLDHADAEQRLGRDLTPEESAAWERAFWLALPEDPEMTTTPAPIAVATADLVLASEW